MEQLENELNEHEPSELPSHCFGDAFSIHVNDVSDNNAPENQVNLRQLEFLRLDEHRILVILVLDDRSANRVIHIEEPFSDNELSQAAALINRALRQALNGSAEFGYRQYA